MKTKLIKVNKALKHSMNIWKVVRKEMILQKFKVISIMIYWQIKINNIIYKIIKAFNNNRNRTRN